MGNVPSLSEQEERQIRDALGGTESIEIMPGVRMTITVLPGQRPRPQPLRRLLRATAQLVRGDWRPSPAAVRDLFRDVAAHGRQSDWRAWAEAAPEPPLPLLARAVQRLVREAGEAGGELDAAAGEALSAAFAALNSATEQLIPSPSEFWAPDEDRAEAHAAAALHAQQLVETGWLHTAASLVAGALAERRSGSRSCILLQLPPAQHTSTGARLSVLEHILMTANSVTMPGQFLPPGSGHELSRVLTEALTDCDVPALVAEAAWELRDELEGVDLLRRFPLNILHSWLVVAAADGGPAAGSWFGRRATISARVEALAPTLRQLALWVLADGCRLERRTAMRVVGNAGSQAQPSRESLVPHLPPLPQSQMPQLGPSPFDCGMGPLHDAVEAAQWLANAAGVDLVPDSAAWLLAFEACLHMASSKQEYCRSWVVFGGMAADLLARLPPREAAAAAAALEPLLAADLEGELVTAQLLARAHSVLLPDRLAAAALPAVEATVRERARRGGDEGHDQLRIAEGVALLWVLAQRGAAGPADGLRAAATGPAVTALKALRALSRLPKHAASALEAAQGFGRERGRLDLALQAAFDAQLEELRARGRGKEEQPTANSGAGGQSDQSPSPAAAVAVPAHCVDATLPPALLPACANPACSNLEGPSEAALPTQRCRGCLTLRYCGTACQTADWPRHKARCRELRRAGAAAGAVAAPSGPSSGGL